MIRRLVLVDYVLLERLELELGPGLNALSGGSGEGKTLIVEALRLLSGGPGGARLVRRGAAEAHIAAEVEVGSPARRQALAEAGVVDAAWVASGAPLRLARVIDRRGRSRASANGAPVPLTALRSAGQLLVEVFGQGQAPLLCEEAHQLELLDACAGTGPEAAAYARERSEALRLARERDELLERARALEAAGSREEEERAALGALAPEPGEWDALLEAEERLEDAAGDLELLGRSVERLSDDDEASLALRLRQVLGELHRRGAASARRGEALEALEGALAQLEAGAELLRRERDAFETDQAEAERVRARLAAWRRTARQVGRAPEALAARRAELAARPDAASLRREQRAREEQLARLLPGLERRAAGLSRRRRSSAAELGRTVAGTLPGLGMPQGRFEVELLPATGDATGTSPALPEGTAAWEALERAHELVLAREPAPGGRERSRFTFAAGPGTELAPLSSASGGELSRLLLALASAAASGAGERVPVLVFDEIDANVGARLGAAVGDCLTRLAHQRQVLLVTHLAPVAARAARHLRVVREGATSRAELLEGQARLEELAVMIRGHPVTGAARAQAQELLEEARAAQALLTAPGDSGGGGAARQPSPREGPRKARQSARARARPAARAL